MNTITDVLKNNGQQEVLELISQGKQFPQLEKLDLERLLKNAKLSVLSKSIKSEEISTDRIEELPVQDIPAIERQKDTFYKLGMAQLRKQRLGVVILSGGQGSRLGFDHAKGMFDVGVRRSVSIFELLVESLSKLTEEIGAPVPLFLMTSRENNEEVQQFFRQHKYFGYPVDYVDFFVQNEYPALDRKANLYVNQAGKLHMLPSGNGDWYESLAASGILSKPHFAQVEWLNVVAVDNPLQNMADPVFLGAMLASHCLAGAKVIRKASPEEKVGTICQISGKPGIIEYYELPEALRVEKNETGEYKYQFGVTLNYIFQKSALDNCLARELPIHYVNKSVRVDGENTIDLIKAETLILDMIAFFDTVCVYEIVRGKEFAPIKNKTGTDSVDTARALLEKNGIRL